MSKSFACFFVLTCVLTSQTRAGQLAFDGSCAGEQYARAAKVVASRMLPCLRRINPLAADEVASYLRTSGPLRVVCDPKAAESETECAHVERYLGTIFLTRPGSCGHLENTLFHEVLHLASSLDGMTAPHHNDPVCRAYDAIYAAAEICFPSQRTLTQAGVGWYGCRSAITEEKAANAICDKLPVVVDDGYQSCRPREL